MIAGKLVYISRSIDMIKQLCKHAQTAHDCRNTHRRQPCFNHFWVVPPSLFFLSSSTLPGLARYGLETKESRVFLDIYRDPT